MSKNLRLVPKFNENCLVIVCEYNGDVRIIAQVLLPNDHQISDNVEVADEICGILKKRIRKSV